MTPSPARVPDVANAEPHWWSVGVSRTIDAPSSDVWDVIGAPGNLERCHPFCRHNPVRSWPGAGSRDEVHYLSGWVYERTFIRWIEGSGYDLEIGGHGEPTSLVSWRITPVGAGACRLSITIFPHVLRHAPAPVRWLPVVLLLRPLLRRYLVSVARGVEWVATRGGSVAHNQFGRHVWFS